MTFGEVEANSGELIEGEGVTIADSWVVIGSDSEKGNNEFAEEPAEFSEQGDKGVLIEARDD